MELKEIDPNKEEWVPGNTYTFTYSMTGAAIPPFGNSIDYIPEEILRGKVETAVQSFANNPSLQLTGYEFDVAQRSIIITCKALAQSSLLIIIAVGLFAAAILFGS